MRFLWFLLLLPALVQAQIVPGISRTTTYPAPAEPGAGAWSSTALGTGVCTSVTDSAGTLTIEASGPDIDNGCLVYQTLNTATAQVYGRVSTLSGTAAATTKVGAIIANSTASDSADCMVWWNDVVDETRGVTTAADGQAEVGGITGNATAIPVHVGVTFTDSTNLCQLFDNATATTPADPTADFLGVPQPHQSYSMDASAPVIAGFYVQSGHASNTATVTITDYEAQEAIDLADSGGDPDAGLFFRSDFNDGTVDISATGFTNFNTMYGKCDLGLDRSPTGKVACPDPENRCWRTQACDGNETHAYAYTVVASDNGITPRAGGYMIRYETRAEDYATGTPPGTTNERVQLKIDDDNTAAKLVYNKTYWIGFSRYMPSAEYSPTYTDTFFQLTGQPNEVEHEIYITYRPQNAGDTTATSFRAACAYWTDASTRVQCNDPEIGWQNPIDAYTDEWIDFRVEVKFHRTNGVYKVWTRRAATESAYTLQVDYSGPLGRYETDKVYRLDFQLYGGGGFPLVLYYDEFKFASEDTGVMTDVDPPDISAAP